MTPRRKRLLVALAALLALSGGFWWMSWPMIDSRLVGTWRSAYGEVPITTLELRSDGTGSESRVFVGPSDLPPTAVRWSASGDTVVLRYGSLALRIEGMISRLTRGVIGIGNRKHRFKLIAVSPTEFDYFRDEWPDPFRFVRVPD